MGNPSVVYPPLHLVADPTADWIIFIAGYLALLYFAVYWLRALRLARDSVRPILLNASYAVLLFILISAGVHALRLEQTPVNAVPIFAGVVFFVAKMAVRRSRYIPAHVRRAVIARDLKGVRYDPRKHHFDHIWPFVLGGSHTVDNLRIIERSKNQRKGRKPPRLGEMLWG